LCTVSQVIKPTVLIGTSGKGKTFTKEVVEAMAAINAVFFSALSVSADVFISL